MRRNATLAVLLTSLAIPGWLVAKSVYLEPERFLSQVFDDDVPEPEVIWITSGLRKRVTEILSHEPEFLRVRYWRRGKRSVWILEEIGKEKPITTGFVIENAEIRRVEVLVYRESRGWEVRQDFFTEQFLGARLEDGGGLDSSIDNISGATLSVRALRRLAEVALVLDREVRDNDDPS